MRCGRSGVEDLGPRGFSKDFEVCGSGFRIWGFSLTLNPVEGLGLMGLGFTGLGFRAFKFKLQRLGLRVLGYCMLGISFWSVESGFWRFW